MKLGTSIKITKGPHKHMIGILIDKKANLCEVALTRYNNKDITTKVPQSYIKVL
jgi:hypothetical protein